MVSDAQQRRPLALVLALPWLLLACVLAPRLARADFPPPGGSWDPARAFNIGPTVSWLGSQDAPNAFLPGLDLTYADKINAPLFWWMSAGFATGITDEDRFVSPYGEAGLSMLFFNVGAGYRPLLSKGTDPLHLIHLYAGISIPVWTPCANNLLFITPYYRPGWTLESDTRVFHEVGAAIKWLFALGSR